MHTSFAAPDVLGSLPGDRLERLRALQRLAEDLAERESASALRTAGGRHDGPASEVLSIAAAVWDGECSLSTRPASVALARQLAQAILSPGFQATLSDWIVELRGIAETHPGSGACTIATAMQLWQWTLSHVQASLDGEPRETATWELGSALCGLLAARSLVLEVVDERHAPTRSNRSPEAATLFMDLSHVQAARAAGVAATRCAEVVFGYRQHQAWDAEGCAACYRADDLDALEGLVPGIASAARAYDEVIEADGSHEAKAGPCVRFAGVETFLRLRAKLDGCLTGARLARDRAAALLPAVVAR
jgi:hypothetical protein